jgi:hypothetical protein
MADTASNTVIGKYRLDPVAEFEGPRMPPTALFTKSDPQHLAHLLERTPAGSYNKAANQLFTSVHTWLVRDDAGMVLLVDTCFGNLKNRLPTHVRLLGKARVSLSVRLYAFLRGNASSALVYRERAFRSMQSKYPAVFA